MQTNEGYTEPGGIVILDTATLRRVIDLLRSSAAERRACFYCQRQLVAGLCASCDRP